MDIWSLQGVKQLGRGSDHTPHLAPTSKKEYSYIFIPLPGIRGLLNGELCLYLSTLPTNCQNAEMGTHFEYVNPKLSTVCFAKGADRQAL
jgi:hypothetical protein